MRTGRANNYQAGSVIADPIRKLAGEVVLRSVQDLRSEDPLKALDALAFWLDDDQGAGFWLNVLGFEWSDRLFVEAVGNGAEHAEIE